MPFVTRYTTTANGAITFTGNTMGLSKETNVNKPGIQHAIGAFITTNTTLRDGTYPLGTTSSYLLNSSSAVLQMPAGSTVLYAELIWGGSYVVTGETVATAINNNITFATPVTSASITPAAATSFTITATGYYIRSADVTALVQAGGAGTYTAAGIPGTQSDTDNSANHAGWTLAVVYQNGSLPSRNMTVFVGNEVVNSTTSTSTATVSGFATPPSGTLKGRLMVSAQEGDATITGDQMQFGPTSATLTAISGPNNPVNNFFCSQINDDTGALNTLGTFGTSNATPGTNIVGGRQGWDITNVDVSARLINNQTSAVIRGTTTGDVYVINGLGLQVDVNAPIISLTKSASPATAFLGDTITYTLILKNTGTASANSAVIQSTSTPGTSFVTGSVTINGSPSPAANPFSGIALGTISNGQTYTIVYRTTVTSRPASPPSFSDQASVSYTFQSVSGGATFNGTATSGTAIVAAGNFPPSTSNISATIAEDTVYSGAVTGSDPEGYSLSYTLTSAPSRGTTVLNPNGTFTYTPAPNFFGTDSFSVTVSDGAGGTAVSTIVITVTPVNDSPVAQDVNASTPEDTPAGGQIIASDTDGDPLTYTLTTPPSHGTVVVNADGSYLYTPSLNYNGLDTFTVTVSDGAGGSDTALVTITVTPVNDLPVTSDVSQTTPEDTPISGAVLATDVDGDSLTFTVLTQPTHGTVALNANGTYVYTPGLNFFGTDSFTVQVSDGQGGTAIASVTITVTPVNDAPVANDRTDTTAEDTPLNGQIVATDSDGDSLTYTITSQPLNGSVTIDGTGAYVYTPNLNYNGTDTFAVTVSDGNGGSDVANVTVIITPVNDAPVAGSFSETTLEDTPLSGVVTAADVDGDVLVYTIFTPPTYGTVVMNADGTYVYTPSLNFFGPDSFTVLVDDGNGGTAIASVTITVTPVNDPPVAADVTDITAEDTPSQGQIIATDSDGDALTYVVSTPPANGAVTVAADGSYVYTPSLNFNGVDSFVVTVSDTGGLSDTAVVTITVTPVNDPPAAPDVNQTVAEDTAASGAVIATDVDGDVLTFSLLSPAANGTAVVNADGTYVYTPNVNFTGVDSFDVLVSDGNGGTASSTVTITVTPVNDAPVTADVADTTPEDTASNGQIVASDPDGDSLTYTVTAPPSNGTVIVNLDGSYIYAPAADFNGVDVFTVTVADGNGGSAVSTVTVTVTPVNDPPVAPNSFATTPEDTAVAGAVAATDVDGDTLVYSLLTAPTHGTAVVNGDGTYTYTPDLDFAGTDSFTVLVDDGNGGTAIGSVTITVTSINDVPVAGDVTDTTPEDTPSNGQIVAVDQDGDILTYTVTTPPHNGTATVNTDGSYVYSPAPDFNGVDTFIVTVSDGNGGSDTATVTISVTPVNDAPVANDSSVSTLEDTPVNGAVTATDVDGDVLTYTLLTTPAHGIVSVSADGTYVYTPNTNFYGADSFTVLVSDGNGGEDIAGVSITVTPVNDAPVAQDVTDTTAEDIPSNGQIVATDVDGDALTYAVTTTPANGTASVAADGSYVYTPSLNYNGTDSFVVTVSDGAGGSDTAIVTITVTPVNDSPVALDSSVTTPEDTVLAGTLTATDVEGDSLTYSLNTNPANGTAVVNADGSYSYTPNLDFYGMDSFTVLVADGNGGSDIASVMITVTPVNDAPAANDAAGTTPEDRPLSGQVIAVDADGDILTYTITTVPLNGTATIAGDGSYVYTPNLNFNGTDSFVVTVSDGNGGTDTATVSITVTPVNDIPVAVDASGSTPEDTPLNGAVTATDVDGDTLTFTLLTAPTNGTAVVNPDGTYLYTPNANFHGNESFTVLVSDGNGGTDIAGVSITVTSVNDAPVALDVADTTAEDVPSNGQIIATDADGDSLTYTVTTPAANGTAAVAADGSYVYTPNANFNGTDSFVVTVDDGVGGTDTSTVTIVVTPVNDAPVAVDSIETTPEDTAFAGTVTATDVDGDTLTFSTLTSPSNGVLALNGDGTYVYTPNVDFHGTDSFTVLVSDGNGGQDIASVTMTVTPVNDAPVALDATDTTAEDVPSNGQITATDSDGDALTYVLTTAPLNGTATVNADGSYVYTPNLSFNGTDSFIVTVDDGNGGTDTSTVTITVTPVNDAPVAPDSNVSTPEDTPLAAAVTATDVDGDLLTYSVLTTPSNGVLVLNGDGTYTYTPNGNFHGADSFTYTVSDGNGGTDTGSVFLTVTPVNDAPVAPDYTIGTRQERAVTGNYQAADADGDVLVYTIEAGSEPVSGTAVITAAGTYTYTPNAGFAGTDSFVVTVNDGNGGTDTGTITVIVTPISNPALVDDAADTIAEDTAFAGNLPGNPPPLNTIIYTLNSAPANGTAVVQSNGDYTYTPNPDFNGTDTFTILATTSPDGQTDVALITMTVTPVNDAPVADDVSDTTAEDTVSTGQIIAVDVDGDTLTYTVTTAPANGTAVVFPDGSYSYTPALNFNGTDSFIVTVDDGNGGTDTATVTIVVTPVNDPPAAADASISTPEDTPISGAVTATDVDGDTLTYSLLTTPSNGSAVVNGDGTYTYTPNADFYGTDSFTVLVSDGNGGEDIASVTVAVTPVNDPPTAGDVTDTTAEDTPSIGQIIAFDPDFDSLTYTVTTPAANGTAVVDADGSYTYTPALNFNGVDSFVVLVDDGNGGTDTSTVTVTVTPVNDAPVAANSSETIAEDTTLSSAVTATDVDGDTLTYSVLTSPSNGAVVMNADGTYTYTPNANFHGTDSFTVLVSDGNGGEAIASVTVNVTPVNDPPTAQDVSDTTSEDKPSTGQVTAADIDGDLLTYSLQTPPSNGTAVVAADGSYTYTPAPNFNGVDSFVVLVDDGNGGTDTSTVTVTVTPVNDPPVAADAAVTTAEDTAVSGAVTAADVDGDALVYSLLTSAGNGTALVAADGSYTYTPNTNFFGSDSFSVLVSDGNGGEDIATVAVTVTPVNDPPVAGDVADTTPEDTPSMGQIIAVDPDFDILTYTVTTQAANGTAVVQPDGSYMYTPAPNFNGVDSFIVTISDGNGGTDTSTVTVTVTPVNDPPVAADSIETVAEDTTLSSAVTATDVDGDTLTYSVLTNPVNGAITMNADGTYTYTPNADFNGTDSFTVLVSDGNGGEDIASVTVNVTPVNDAPVALDVSDTTAEDKPSTGQVTATDVDGDVLTYSLQTPPANGTAIVGSDGSYTYTPALHYNGTDSFVVLVDDGNGGTDTAVVTVTITPVNDPPVAVDAAVTTVEDTPFNGAVTATDVDGDTLTYSLFTGASSGTALVAADGTYTYTPNAGFFGTDSFTVAVSDGNGGVDLASVTVTVTPVNDSPIAEDVADMTAEDTPSNGQILATDTDFDPLTYTVTTPPANGTAVVQPDGSYTYTPNLNFNGTDTFIVTVSDGNGGTDTSTVTVTVTPVNDAPVASGSVSTTAEDTPVNGAVTAVDADGDALTFSLLTSPSYGIAVVNVDGTYTYTPQTEFFGTDSFTVLVDDGNGGTAIAPVTVNVTPVNDAPVASDSSPITAEDSPLNGQIVATDVDNDPLTYTLTTAPVNGTVVLQSDGSYAYTPNANFNGTDSFVVTVSDGNGGSDTATISITITPVNDAPVASPASATTAEDTPVNGAVIATDVDGDTLTFTLHSGPTNGTAVVNADGTYTYTPFLNFFGSDSFTVQVEDGNGGEDIAAVTLTVTPVNDPPIASNILDSTAEDTPSNGQIVAFDSDGDPLSYTLTSPPANGTVVLNGDGSYTYTPNPDFFGTDSFEVTVDDGNGGTSIVLVTINVLVSPVNDAPVITGSTAVTAEDTPVNGIITAVDPEGDSLTFLLLNGPNSGTATVAPDGSYVYTPNANFFGTDSFTVSVSDGNGGTALGAVIITVTPVNDAPTASNITDTTAEDTPSNGQIVAFDTDGDPLTYTLTTPAANGSVVLGADGSYTYTPNPNFNGTDSFVVTVSDGNGGSAPATVTLAITPVNDPPITADNTLTTAEDTQAAGSITASDPDGDVLQYSVLTAPANGEVTINSVTGSYTYTPSLNFNGTDFFTVLVDDGNGGTAISGVTVTVTPVNDPPLPATLTYTSEEDSVISAQVATVDPDGDVLTYTLQSPPSQGTVVVSADGTFTYTPNLNYNGVDSFTVTADDSLGGTGIVTVNLVITPVNDDPVTAPISLTTAEDTPIAGAVTATDVDGDVLTFALNTPPANGAAVVAIDGSFTYTPSTNYNGEDAFTVLVSDGNGGTAIADVNVTVTQVNDPPTAADQTVRTILVTPVTGQLEVIDPDSFSFIYSVVVPPANGTAVVDTDGRYTYTANAGFLGYDFFTIQIDDGDGGIGLATITADVAPVFQTFSTTITTTENTPIQSVVTLILETPTIYTLLDAPNNGTLVFNPDGTFIYTPNPEFTGTDSFSVLSDTGLEATINIIVLANQGPVLPPASAVTVRNAPVSGSLSAADPEGEAVQYGLTAGPANGIAVVTAQGTFTYTPNRDYVGTDTFSVYAVDESGNSTIASVSITINPYNRAPVASNAALTTQQGAAVTGQIAASDSDGDLLAYSAAVAPNNGSVQLQSDGSFVYTPNAAFIGVDSFVIIVSDAFGGAISVTVVVTVEGISGPADPPVVSPVSVRTVTGGTVAGFIPATDPAGGVLLFSLAQAPAGGSVQVNADGSFIYRSNSGFVGTDVFYVRVVSTASGLATEYPIYIVVEPSLAVPTDPGSGGGGGPGNGGGGSGSGGGGTGTGGSTPPVKEIALDNTGNPITGQVGSVPLSGALFYALAEVAVNGSVTLGPDGSFQYDPDSLDNDRFVIAVSDAAGNVVLVVVRIRVKDGSIVVTDYILFTRGLRLVRGRVEAQSSLRLALTYRLLASPEKGSVKVARNGAFTYRLGRAAGHGDVNDQDVFYIEVTDSDGRTAVSRITIIIEPEDDE
ncbi:tandem-95 repeat protein [Paenibacillus sp. GCM10023252]|uniref:tandem-95 repeat protein n=1 Tax=Paenibacillus sp. GCM10023252 TaxID=3252649 RepID=UPI00361A9B5B